MYCMFPVYLSIALLLFHIVSTPPICRFIRLAVLCAKQLMWLYGFCNNMDCSELSFVALLAFVIPLQFSIFIKS